MLNNFILKIKRAETPFYARLKQFGRAVLYLQLPIPRFLDPVYKVILYFRYLRYEIAEKLSVAFFRYPVTRMLCVSVGKRFRMERIPSISGNPKIYIGDDVYISGTIAVIAGRVFSNPELRIGNRTFIADGCSFSVAKSIVIGDEVLIAGECSISDYSQHPLDPEKRVSVVQVNPVAVIQVEADEVRPVRIGNRAWLGRRATILPGVTIGEDAVVGACAVVTKDVPPGAICVGNPGRILSRTVYDPRPSSLVNVD
jgi:acetyltransferase-like isoleucine patch superfamily enzyme